MEWQTSGSYENFNLYRLGPNGASGIISTPATTTYDFSPDDGFGSYEFQVSAVLNGIESIIPANYKVYWEYNDISLYSPFTPFLTGPSGPVGSTTSDQILDLNWYEYTPTFGEIKIYRNYSSPSDNSSTYELIDSTIETSPYIVNFTTVGNFYRWKVSFYANGSESQLSDFVQVQLV